MSSALSEYGWTTSCSSPRMRRHDKRDFLDEAVVREVVLGGFKRGLDGAFQAIEQNPPGDVGIPGGLKLERLKSVRRLGRTQ